MSSRDDYETREFQKLSIDEMVAYDDYAYRPPVYRINLHHQPYYMNLLSTNLLNKFGTTELKRLLFYLGENDFLFFNHGGGLCFKPAQKYIFDWTEYFEQQPLRFVDRELNPLLADLIRLFAQRVLYCKPTELCLIDNCTFGFNSILNSLHLDETNRILILSTTYSVYKDILDQRCRLANSPLEIFHIDFPILDDADYYEKIVRKFQELYLKQNYENRTIKYFFIDTIPSHPAIQLPFSALIDMLKAKRPDIITIVDAAHGLGSIRDFHFKGKLTRNIDLMLIGLHKSFCGPKGTSLLFRNERLKYASPYASIDLKPAVQSLGVNKGFISQFVWSGSKNYANFLGLFATYHIWVECLGGFDHVIDYCTELIGKAAEYCAGKWGTRCLVSPQYCTNMVHIQLPEKFNRNILVKHYSSQRANYPSTYETMHLIDRLMNIQKPFEYTSEQAQIIQDYFYYDLRMELTVKPFLNYYLFVRVTAHIYNKFYDYVCLSDAVWQNNYLC